MFLTAAVVFGVLGAVAPSSPFAQEDAYATLPNESAFNMYGWVGNQGSSASADYLISYLGYTRLYMGFDNVSVVMTSETCRDSRINNFDNQYRNLSYNLNIDPNVQYIFAYWTAKTDNSRSHCQNTGESVFARANSQVDHWGAGWVYQVYDDVQVSEGRYQGYVCVQPYIYIYPYAACATHLVIKSETAMRESQASQFFADTLFGYRDAGFVVTAGGDLNGSHLYAQSDPWHSEAIAFNSWIGAQQGKFVDGFNGEATLPSNNPAVKIDYVFSGGWTKVWPGSVTDPVPFAWPFIPTVFYGRVSDHMMMHAFFG